MKQALQHIINSIDQTTFDSPMRISVVDANNPDLSKAWVTAFHEHFPKASVSTYQISPAIAVHTGEKSHGRRLGSGLESNLKPPASNLNRSE